MSRLRFVLVVTVLICVLAPAGASARPAANGFPDGRTTITAVAAVSAEDLTPTSGTLRGSVSYTSDECVTVGATVSISSAQMYVSASPTMDNYAVNTPEFTNGDGSVACGQSTTVDTALTEPQVVVGTENGEPKYGPLSPDTTYYFQQTACGLNPDLSTSNCLISDIKSFHTPSTTAPPPPPTAPAVVKDPHVEPVGSVQVGNVATYFPGTYSGTGPIAITHSWLRCSSASALATCVGIPGTTGLGTYTPTDADAKQYLAVKEHAANGVGSVDRFSNRVQAFQPPFAAAPKPRLRLPAKLPALGNVLTGGFSVGVVSDQNGKATGQLFASAKNANKFFLAQVLRKPKGKHHRKPVQVAKGSVRLKAGKKGTLKLKFTRDAKKRLKARSKVKLTLVITVTGASGKNKVVRKPVTFSKPKAHKHKKK